MRGRSRRRSAPWVLRRLLLILHSTVSDMRARTLVATALVLTALPVAAQDLAADSSCTSESCRIEIKPVLLIGFRLEQGGETLPRYGLGTPRVADAVGDSPAALVHAFEYERHLRTVNELVLGATALLLLEAVNLFGVFSDRVRVGLSFGAAGLAVASIPSGRRARRAAEDAVDAYNESLPQSLQSSTRGDL